MSGASGPSVWSERDRLAYLAAVARLSRLTNKAMSASYAYALATRTKGVKQRFVRMREVAERTYFRLCS